MFEAARVATADDVDALVRIVETHSATIGDARGGQLLLDHEALEAPLSERLRTAVSSDDALVVVGEFDGVIFGLAHARLHTLPDSTIAKLEHFVVDEDARGVAIGEAMMNDVIEWARAAGCAGIDSKALPGDRSTKNFFESFGLKARLLTVHYRL